MTTLDTKEQLEGSPLGEILVQAGRLTSQELEMILALQGREKILFDEAAVASGILSQEDINWALAAVRVAQRASEQIEGSSIGTILVEAGRITPEQANAIVALQNKEQILFGEAAVASGILNEEDVRWALACQYSFPFTGKEDQSVSAELLVLRDPFGARVEEFRSIRSALILSGVGSVISSICVISAGKREGKSFLAANLALVFAQLGTRTVLVDFNFRSPRLHTLFQIKNNCGASSLIIKRTFLENAVKKSSLSALDILPSGPNPPNPLELLSRREAAQLLQSLKGQYEVVIVDTPPFFQAADAQVIAGLCDATVLVALKGATRNTAFGKVKRQLETGGAKIVGAVLNEIPVRL